MGVGMINTVLFMAVIFCGVWNIVPHRLQQLEKKNRAAEALTLVGVCLYLCLFCFFHISMCIYPFYMNHFSWRGEAINNFCTYCGKHKCSASGCSWPLCVWDNHGNLPRELCRSLLICTPLLSKHLGEKTSLTLLSSIFLPSASLSLPIFPSAYTVASTT